MSGLSAAERNWKPEEQQQKIVPLYRKGFEPSNNPNFAGPNYERRAETIQTTLQEMDTLISQVEDNLESVYRNTLLKMLVGMKSALMDEYYRLAESGAHKDNPVVPSELHPATLDQFERALESWGLEIKPRVK